MILAVICCGLLGYFLWEWLRDDYPGKDKRGTFFYTKKWMFRLMMALNSRKSRIIEKNNDLQTGRRDRGHGRSLTDRLMLERCQPLEENETFAIDTTYFNGFAEDGTFVALRIARKHNREGELWVMLNIPGVGFFQHPIHPDTGVYNMGVNEYRALGCKFQMLEPMRRWKVTYNGLLRQGLCRDFANKPDKYVTVILSFTWECYNDPFDFDVDADKSLLADAVAKQKWTREFWSKVRGKHRTHYAQCGELSGAIKIEGHPDRHVYLKGFREHTFGVRDWTMFYRYAVHYIRVPETGLMAMVSVLWMPDYITLAIHEVYSTEDTEIPDVSRLSITQDRYPAEQYSFIFHADDVKYHVDLEAVMTPEVYHYPHRTSRVLERSCTYTVNGRPGLGLTEYHYRNHDGPAIECLPPETLPLLAEPAPYDMVDDKEKITLAFHKRSCCSTLLVGGKGSQLALLTSVQDKTGVRVPPGFCVTLAAFNLQLKFMPTRANKRSVHLITLSGDPGTFTSTSSQPSSEATVDLL